MSASFAASGEAVVDPDPLRPADTSSPRDTLNTFLADSSQFIEDFRQKTAADRTYQAYRRASQTLDFSATPDGDTWFVRNERIALLQELLARIELPPQKEIPGDAEVADGTITQAVVAPPPPYPNIHHPHSQGFYHLQMFPRKQHHTEQQL